MQAHGIGGRLNRRRFVAGVTAAGVSAAGLGVLGGCGILPGQAPSKLPRVGYLTLIPLSLGAGTNAEGFRQGLRDHGWEEGRTIIIEWRSAEGDDERLPRLAAELVGLSLDVIVALTPPTVRAVRELTDSIPIVMVGAGDPVEQGFAASLARPGGNMTGNADIQGLRAKRLQLLSEAVPNLSRVAVFWDPNWPTDDGYLRELQAAAAGLNIQVQSLEVRMPDDFDAAFDAAVNGGAQALMDGGNNTVVSTQRARIFEFAERMRLPGIWRTKQWVLEGGLMTYGANQPGLQRRAAGYVDKIVRGAKPADLPLTRPTEFDLVINLRTAQAIGLSIPPEMAAQVTDWVQ